MLIMCAKRTSRPASQPATISYFRCEKMRESQASGVVTGGAQQAVQTSRFGASAVQAIIVKTCNH